MARPPLPRPPLPVLLRANAKLTLSLRVTGVRADGYHLIDAEMVSVDLYDELHVTAGDGLTFSVDEGGRGIPAGPDNLVARALAAVGHRAEVLVVKRIPPGAGLGGGSADAAAVLRWAGVGDLDVAVALGADVPFCVVGGRARVRGVGEVVEPLPHRDRKYTLLTPPFGCSTVEVYRAWDRLGGPHGEAGNDLEAAALAVRPELAEWRERLAHATGRRPRLAGSGSTWFVEGAHPGPGLRVVHTSPVGGSVHAVA